MYFKVILDLKCISSLQNCNLMLSFMSKEDDNFSIYFSPSIWPSSIPLKFIEEFR